jgi:hypothetical protein
MHLKLDLDRVINADVTHGEYDPELDDVQSIITNVCHGIAGAGGALFHVSGFGQDTWPVDITTDLPVLLEQLPAVLHGLEQGEPDVTLDFYEQGIERTIRFENDGDHIVACCESMTDWVPNPSQERLLRRELCAMLGQVRETFMQFTARVAPELAAHPWLRAWAAGERDRKGEGTERTFEPL